MGRNVVTMLKNTYDNETRSLKNETIALKKENDDLWGALDGTLEVLESYNEWLHDENWDLWHKLQNVSKLVNKFLLKEKAALELENEKMDKALEECGVVAEDDKDKQGD